MDEAARERLLNVGNITSLQQAMVEIQALRLRVAFLEEERDQLLGEYRRTVLRSVR